MGYHGVYDLRIIYRGRTFTTDHHVEEINGKTSVMTQHEKEGPLSKAKRLSNMSKATVKQEVA